MPALVQPHSSMHMQEPDPATTPWETSFHFKTSLGKRQRDGDDEGGVFSNANSTHLHDAGMGGDVGITGGNVMGIALGREGGDRGSVGRLGMKRLKSTSVSAFSYITFVLRACSARLTRDDCWSFFICRTRPARSPSPALRHLHITQIHLLSSIPHPARPSPSHPAPRRTQQRQTQLLLLLRRRHIPPTLLARSSLPPLRPFPHQDYHPVLKTGLTKTDSLAFSGIAIPTLSRTPTLPRDVRQTTPWCREQGV
jgi:hypothetical protein